MLVSKKIDTVDSIFYTQMEELAVERYFEIEDRIPEFFLELVSLNREKLVDYNVDTLLDLTSNVYTDPINAVAELSVTVKYYSDEQARWIYKAYSCYLDDCGKRLVEDSEQQHEFRDRVDHWLALW